MNFASSALSKSALTETPRKLVVSSSFGLSSRMLENSSMALALEVSFMS